MAESEVPPIAGLRPEIRPHDVLRRPRHDRYETDPLLQQPAPAYRTCAGGCRSLGVLATSTGTTVETLLDPRPQSPKRLGSCAGAVWPIATWTDLATMVGTCIADVADPAQSSPASSASRWLSHLDPRAVLCYWSW